MSELAKSGRETLEKVGELEKARKAMTKLFETYLEQQPPAKWKELFREAAKMAFNVKYMFREEVVIAVRRAGSERDPSGTRAGSERDRSGTRAGSERDRSGIGAGSERDPSGIGARSERDRSGVGAGSERDRSAIRACFEPTHS